MKYVNNWQRRYLNPLEQREIDPTGKGNTYISMLKSFSKVENTPANEIFNTMEIGVTPQPAAHEVYQIFNSNYLTKIGPQGGHYPFQTLLNTLREYYNVPEGPVEPNYSLLGLNYLCDYVHKIKSIKGTHHQFQNFNIMPANTAAGLPFMGKKHWANPSNYYTDAPVELNPALPGERILKGKFRCMFIDSEQNVRIYNTIAGSVRMWFKTYLPYYAGWKNPDEELRPQITRFIDKGSFNIEIDAKAMDQHVTWEMTKTLILPLFDAVLDEQEYWFVSNYFEKIFTQPLFLGDSLINGMHTLFSGVGPTNDIETHFDVIVALGIVLSFHIPLRDVLILANGDDMTVLISNRWKHLKDRIITAFTSEYENLHIEVSTEKCRFDTPDVQFCKKLYYRKGIRDSLGNLLGAYPSVLALNSIKFPEHKQENTSQDLIRTLQILDNLDGSPDYGNTVAKVYSYLRKTADIFEISSKDVEAVSYKDWWFRLYGEKWDPTSSRTFKLMLKLGLIIKLN